MGARPREPSGDASASSRRPAPAGAWRRSCCRAPTLHVHRAEPAVPDGQPDRVQRLRAAHVHRRRRVAARRCSGWRCITTGTDAELDAFAARRREDRRGGAPRLRRVPGVRGQHLHVHRRLPAVGQRRRDGASQQHHPDVSASSIRTNRLGLLDTVSHEFFHAWNVERIRPRSLEPFNFEDANMSGELWLAEGFTSYYGPLITDARRADRASTTSPARWAAPINTVIAQPGPPAAHRRGDEPAGAVRRCRDVDRSDATSTTPSSRTTRGARRSASALDLTLRDRSDGKVTLDHFMRALWQKHGKPGGTPAGLRATARTRWTICKAALAAVSGDAAFADDFFARYIQGREVVDYARLLARAGLVLRPGRAGTCFAGALRLQDAPERRPADAPRAVRFAGLRRRPRSRRRHRVDRRNAGRNRRRVRPCCAGKPGDGVPIRSNGAASRSRRRSCSSRIRGARLSPPKRRGQPLSDAQKRFREAWLRSATRNVF